MVERIPVEGECFAISKGPANKWICLKDAMSHYSFQTSGTIDAGIATPLIILIPKEYT